MYLNIDDSRLLDDPSESDILNAVENLGLDEYLILNRGEQEYVQVYHHEDDTYQLEYRNGSADRHFAVDPSVIDVEDVRKAFRLYFQNEDLASHWNWELAEFEEAEPGEGEVEYNGIIMDAEWPAQIEAAQEICTISIGGQELERIPFGQEQNMPTSQLEVCGDCGVLQNQLHVPDCEIEQCPACQGQLVTCACQKLEGNSA